MSRCLLPTNFDIFCDSSSDEDKHSQHHSLDDTNLRAYDSTPLSCLPVLHSSNRLRHQVNLKADVIHPDIRAEPSQNLQKTRKLKKPAAGHCSRPVISANTFDVLETVRESESQGRSTSTASRVSSDASQLIRRPGTMTPLAQLCACEMT